jgi:hypothetical protein
VKLQGTGVTRGDHFMSKWIICEYKGLTLRYLARSGSAHWSPHVSHTTEFSRMERSRTEISPRGDTYSVCHRLVHGRILRVLAEARNAEEFYQRLTICPRDCQQIHSYAKVRNRAIWRLSYSKMPVPKTRWVQTKCSRRLPPVNWLVKASNQTQANPSDTSSQIAGARFQANTFSYGSSTKTMTPMTLKHMSTFSFQLWMLCLCHSDSTR